VARTPADVLAGADDTHAPTPRPAARNKWLTASVAADAAEVVGRVFDDAAR
jgi:hypothetical protein